MDEHIDLTGDVGDDVGDSQPEEDENSNSNANNAPTGSKGKRKKTSFVWGHFVENEQRTHSTCNHCGTVYQSHSKLDGISNLKTHLKKCTKYPANVEARKQKQLALLQTMGTKSESGSGSVNLVAIGYNKDVCRKKLARMIVLDELAFRFVEGEGFRDFCAALQPKFVVPSRITIARYVMQLYLDEKKKLKTILSSNRQRVCLTTDTWSSIQNINYMALTAHYVDSEWRLQKRILNFVQVVNHKGETIGKMIEACLLEWGIERVFTITVDNASSNDGAIAYMKKKLKTWKTSILDGEFLHMRCCAHIVNLVVSEGLKELDNSIVAIRNCVRYVRSSPSRLLKFNTCVEHERIQEGGNVILDVPTRWNSTYLMLESAVKFQSAFERMEDEDCHYLSYFREVENGKGRVGPPKENDWVKADYYLEFLKLFYQVTIKFSASLYFTSNVYFHELCTIHTHIMSRIRSKDVVLKEMAKGMKLKYDKYWGEPSKLNGILFITVVVDPRFKLRYVEWCFEDIYNDHEDVMIVPNMVQKVKDDFARLFDYYRAMNNSEHEGQSSTDASTDAMDEDVVDAHDPMIARYKRHLKAASSLDRQSEIDKYLLEAPEPVDAVDFDVLGWWKVNSSRYPILSQLARDVLAVPVSTVASESAFSTGGRILDSFRSSLTPKTVQALICTQNWLRSISRLIDLQSQMEDVKAFEELEKEFGNLNLASVE